MATQVTLPELGENISSGDLVRLLVREGDRIEKDQPLLELETDKATIEVPSPSQGTVKQILVKEGQKIAVGQAILSIEDGSESGQPRTNGTRPASADAESRGGKGRRSPEATSASKSAVLTEEAERPAPATPQARAPQPEVRPSATASADAGQQAASTGPADVLLPEL